MQKMLKMINLQYIIKCSIPVTKFRHSSIPISREHSIVWFHDCVNRCTIILTVMPKKLSINKREIAISFKRVSVTI